jgi:hypothetical protein
MRTFADTEVQARLIREMRELYETRGKLEGTIRAINRAKNLRIEKDALVEISTYKAILCSRRSNCAPHQPCDACNRFSLTTCADAG